MMINKNMVLPRHKVLISVVRSHTTRFKVKTSSSGVHILHCDMKCDILQKNWTFIRGFQILLYKQFRGYSS